MKCLVHMGGILVESEEKHKYVRGRCKRAGWLSGEPEVKGWKEV